MNQSRRRSHGGSSGFPRAKNLTIPTIPAPDPLDGVELRRARRQENLIQPSGQTIIPPLRNRVFRHGLLELSPVDRRSSTGPCPVLEGGQV